MKNDNLLISGGFGGTPHLEFLQIWVSDGESIGLANRKEACNLKEK